MQKAQLLLSEGIAAQKNTVIAGLTRLLMEPDSEDLLLSIIDSVPTWGEDQVVECGKQVAAAVSEGLIMSLYQSDILQVAFQLLAPAVEPVVEAWSVVICRLIGQMPVSRVLEECAPSVLRLSDYSQAVALRKAGTSMLQALADLLGCKLTAEMLLRCSRLAQDTDYHVRMAACPMLLAVARAVSAAALHSSIYSEVEALVEDENEDVQREALELLACVIPLLEQEKVEKDVVPLLSRSLLGVSEFSLKAKLAECLGQLCVGLKLALSADLRSHFLSLFTEFANHPSPIIRHQAAFNFPAVLSVLISQPHITYFRVIYTKLCRDERLEVRLPALSSLHEVSKMLSDQMDLFLGLLNEQLDDPSVHLTLCKVLPHCPVQLLSESILRKLAGVLSSAGQWRKQMAVAEVLSALVTKVNARLFMGAFSSVLFKLVTSAPWLLRVKCAEILADLLKWSYYADLKQSIGTFLIDTLGLSKRYVDRAVFLKACLRIIENCSKRFFKKNFLDTVLALGKDPVRNVRILFSQHLLTIRKAIGNDHSDNATRFSAVLNALTSDNCKLIAQNAQSAYSTIMTQAFWKDITSLKEINTEAQRVNFENKQAEEEKEEQEEARKRLLEELTAKARSDIQQVKNGSRSRHSRKPSNIQLSLSPVGKKTPSQESARSNYYRGPARAYVLRTYRRNK